MYLVLLTVALSVLTVAGIYGAYRLADKAAERWANSVATHQSPGGLDL